MTNFSGSVLNGTACSAVAFLNGWKSLHEIRRARPAQSHHVIPTSRQGDEQATTVASQALVPEMPTRLTRSFWQAEFTSMACRPP
jgi:hypothetical protein